MRITVSCRAEAVIAHSYNDFPVGPGQLDLRGDNSPPLPAAAALLPQSDLSITDLAAYGDVAGDLELREVLARLFDVPVDHVAVTAGGSEALFLALTCVADPGGTILMPRPAFPGFEQLAKLTGLRVAPYPPGTVPRRRREPLLVCTPHNPTGVVTTPAAVAWAGPSIWDVSHMSPLDGRLASLTAELDERGIVVFSLSKLLRLPAVRVGCVVARDAAFMAAVVRAKTHLSMSTSRPGQNVAARVLQHPDTMRELADRVAVFARLRLSMLKAVAESTVLTAEPAHDGTHVLLRSVDGRDGWKLLASAGVVGLPGEVFNGSHDAVRLCLAQPDGVVEQAVRIVRAL